MRLDDNFDKMTVLKLIVYLYGRDLQMNGSKATLLDRVKAVDAYEKTVEFLKSIN